MKTISTVLVLIFVINARAAVNCDGAEATIAKVTTWAQLKDYFKKFEPKCGEAVAESVSDVVEKSFNGEGIEGFAKLAAKDRAFKKFVLGHIDSTISDPAAIEKLAKDKCPKGQKSLCAEIQKAAHSALADSAQ